MELYLDSGHGLDCRNRLENFLDPCDCETKLHSRPWSRVPIVHESVHVVQSNGKGHSSVARCALSGKLLSLSNICFHCQSHVEYSRCGANRLVLMLEYRLAVLSLQSGGSKFKIFFQVIRASPIICGSSILAMAIGN